MKAGLVPVCFKSGQDDEFHQQLATLKGLLTEEAEILEAVACGKELEVRV